MKTILVAIILLLLAVVAMAVKVLFVKGGKFPSMHAHDIESRRREALRRKHQKQD